MMNSREIPSPPPIPPPKPPSHRKKLVPRPPGMRRKSFTSTAILDTKEATPNKPSPPPSLSKKSPPSYAKKSSYRNRRVSFSDMFGGSIESGPSPSPIKQPPVTYHQNHRYAKEIKTTIQPPPLPSQKNTSSVTYHPPTCTSTPSMQPPLPPPLPPSSPHPSSFSASSPSQPSQPSQPIDALEETVEETLQQRRNVQDIKTYGKASKHRTMAETSELLKHQKYHEDRMTTLEARTKNTNHKFGKVKKNKRRNTMMGIKAGEIIHRTKVQLEVDQVTELRNIFHLLDKDMDGLLQEDQLLTALATVGVNPTRRIKYELKKRLPRNGVGGLKGKPNGVGFDTFLRIIRSTLLAQPAAVTEMDALAAMYDSPERPGVIKGHQLRHLLTGVQTSSNTALNSTETDLIFKSLGIMEDGDVNIHQYVDTVADGFIRVVDHRRIGDDYRKKIKQVKNRSKGMKSNLGYL